MHIEVLIIVVSSSSVLVSLASDFLSSRVHFIGFDRRSREEDKNFSMLSSYSFCLCICSNNTDQPSQHGVREVMAISEQERLLASPQSPKQNGTPTYGTTGNEVEDGSNQDEQPHKSGEDMTGKKTFKEIWAMCLGLSTA